MTAIVWSFDVLHIHNDGKHLGKGVVKFGFLICGFLTYRELLVFYFKGDKVLIFFFFLISN